jgi:drug/metabolite transporter (DMT)-like permease
MNWLVADFLMFVCSVVLYLALRKASLSKLSTQFNNLASFGIPTLAFGVVALFVDSTFNVTPYQLALLIVTGVVLSYFANVASFKSIELAPNAGYSLVISKSYVVLTTFLAVPLFGAKLSVQTLLAVLLIVAFSTLIMLKPKAAHHAKSTAWLPLAIGVFFAWGFLSLMAKYLFLQGMSTLTFLVYISGIVMICILLEMHKKQVSFKPIRQHFGIFLLIGLTAVGYDFFSFYAIMLAPNIGYVNATNAGSIAAVTVFSIWLFKDEFSWRKLVGVFGVVIGLFLLFVS